MGPVPPTGLGVTVNTLPPNRGIPGSAGEHLSFGDFLLSPLALVFGILHWEDPKSPTVHYAVGLPLDIPGRVI